MMDVVAGLVIMLAALLFILAPSIWCFSRVKWARSRTTSLVLTFAAVFLIVGAVYGIQATTPPVIGSQWSTHSGVFEAVRLEALRSRPFGYVEVGALQIGWFARTATRIGFMVIGGMIGAAVGAMMGLLLHVVVGWRRLLGLPAREQDGARSGLRVPRTRRLRRRECHPATAASSTPLPRRRRA